MPRTDKEKELLKPIATEAGLVSIEWNDMCEAMGLLFGAILHPTLPYPEAALAVWNSQISDKAQRDMLLAAAKGSQKTFIKALPKFYDDIKELCDSAQKLADHRNNVVHAPLTFILDGGQPIGVVANTFFGHPRAARLDGKDLIAAFKIFTDYAEKLKLFARNMTASIKFGPSVRAWPDRPKLPSLSENSLPQAPPSPPLTK
jgi:hypothetical protein